MRKVVVLFLAVVVGAAGLTPGASARPASNRLQLPALVPAPDDALTGALENGDLTTAEYALHRAASVSRLRAVRNEFGRVAPADPHAATLIFRDLALRVRFLDGAERDAAEALLARPNQGGPDDQTLEYNTAEATPIDTPHFRIHYVTSGRHASTLTYATEVSTIMEEVWTREITQLGWREPISDAAWSHNGGNEKFDVYLGNVGADFIYGYCMADVDQPMAQEQHAYCVLDNDFAEFQGISGLDAARVTAAHEFNHAIQFAYDVTDDYWLLEATATWMEDMVYDDLPDASVNDSYQYLSSSSLSSPETPADTWDWMTGFQYGQFIWMRYLHEKFNSPDVIRTLWEHTAQPGNYSINAIESMLAAQTPAADFADSFVEFATWNARASSFYEEGTNYETFVTPKRHKTHTLTGTTPGGGTFTGVEHLSSRNVGFKPGAEAGAEMTLSVDLGAAPMQEARVLSISGSTEQITEIPLTGGTGQVTVPFAGQDEVVLVMSNASNVMNNCDADGWQPGEYSCGGNPAHDNSTFKYAGVIGTESVPPGTGGTTAGPVVTNFKASPNPFTPDCKCRKKTTKVRFTLGEPAVVSLYLFKGTRRLGYFLDGESLDAGRMGPFVWNGKLGRKKAPAGIYKFKLTAVGDGGTTKKTTKVRLKR